MAKAKKLLLIGICGHSGSGKDTVASFIEGYMRQKKKQVRRMALADPMKKFCKEIFAFSDEQLYGPSEKRNVPDLRYKQDPFTGRDWLTPRYALQTLGTDWGRDCYENVWVDYLLRRVDRLKRQGTVKAVIVTDVRFNNEAERIVQEGGHVVSVTRPEFNSGTPDHASEQEQDSAPMQKHIDWRIVNSGTLSDLKVASRAMMGHFIKEL